MHKSYFQTFQNISKEFQRDKVPFDRIMAPCPTMSGRWQYIKGRSEFAQALRGMFGVADRCLSENGTITFSHMRDASAEWAVWLDQNPGKFEEVPNSAFQVWTGYARDMNNNDVFVGANIEYMRFKTFRRVGSSATVNDVTLPDDLTLAPYNRVAKGNFVAPVDKNTYQNEMDQWLLRRGIKPVGGKEFLWTPFKYFMVEMDHDEGNYIQIPGGQPTNNETFRFGMTDSQYNHITNPKNKGTYHVIASKNIKHRVYGLWLCNWMMKKFCNPGEKVLVPFGGEGEMALAALLNQCEVTVVEANTQRYEINEDIIIEWQRRYGS